MALKIFFYGVGVFLVLAPSFLYAAAHGYFQTYWWLDIVMHTLGGMWAGYIGAWFAVMMKEKPRLRYFVLGALVLGACVEVLEYFTDFGRNPFMSYPVDTTKDMVVDILGGLFAGYLFRRNNS
jgi:hypothetical protein